MEISEDRISSLPDNVREHILQFLPLPDAAKSSLLSSKWYNLWMNLPCLVFDANFCQTVEGSSPDAVTRLMFKLFRVLFLHSGPLKQVTISLPILRNFPQQVDQILLFLANNKRIQALTFNMESGYSPFRNNSFVLDKYKLSRVLFSSLFSNLETLRLSCCQLTSASCTVSFEVFSKLTVLELRAVEFQKTCISWSFSCPLLAALTLVNCGCKTALPDIVVEAPKLSFFHFDGFFSSFHFKQSSPVLKDVIIREMGNAYNSNLLTSLAGVETLSVRFLFYQYLCELGGHDLKPREKLRQLRLDEVCMCSPIHISSLVRMIVTSPNLQLLTIQMEMEEFCSAFQFPSSSGTDFHDIIKSVNAQHAQCRLLRRVELKRIKGEGSEMDLIRWLLNSSPALDEMEIQFETQLSDIGKMLIMKELNGYKRASARAQVTIN
ncbi:F-box/FBD/LRR-repeat protein At1g13570 [Linum perenne]